MGCSPAALPNTSFCFLEPGRNDPTYEVHSGQFVDRLASWGNTDGDTLSSLTAYKVYTSPVLLFVAKLDDPPADWESDELKAIGKLLPGLLRMVTEAGSSPARRLQLSAELPRFGGASPCHPP